MPNAGSAWRGWFPVGGELTSGRPDRKEGLYVGAEHPPDHPRVVAGVPLHGANLFPHEPADLGPAVLEWLDRAGTRGRRGDARHRDRARARAHVVRRTRDGRSDRAVPDLPLPARRRLRLGRRRAHRLRLADAARPRRPRRAPGRTAPTAWIDVPAEPDVLVCNIGDMLDRLTVGRYRSTPHRVRNLSGTEPAVVPVLLRPVVGRRGRAAAARRVAALRRRRAALGRAAACTLWDGTYGDYLTAKVAKVFPELFARLDATR